MKFMMTAAAEGAQASKSYEAENCRMACCNHTRSCTELTLSNLVQGGWKAPIQVQVLLDVVGADRVLAVAVLMHE